MTATLTPSRPQSPAGEPPRPGAPHARPSTTILVTALLVVVALYFLVPVYWVVVAATKTSGDLFATNGFWFAPNFVPVGQPCAASSPTGTASSSAGS